MVQFSKRGAIMANIVCKDKIKKSGKPADKPGAALLLAAVIALAPALAALASCGGGGGDSVPIGLLPTPTPTPGNSSENIEISLPSGLTGDIDISGSTVNVTISGWTESHRGVTTGYDLTSGASVLAGKNVSITVNGSGTYTLADKSRIEAIFSAAASVTAAFNSPITIHVADHSTTLSNVGGGSNTANLQNSGNDTSIQFTSFSSEGAGISIGTLGAGAASTYFSGKNVTVSFDSSIASGDLSFGFAARLKHALAAAGANNMSISTTRTPVFKEADMIDVAGNPANLDTGINDGKVFREFKPANPTTGQDVFGGFKVMGDGSSANPFYLQGSSPIKVQDLLWVTPTDTQSYVKIKNFGLKVGNFNQINALSLQVNKKTPIGNINPTNLDAAFADLGIDWSSGNSYIPITLNDIKLFTSPDYVTYPVHINLAESAYLKTVNYIKSNISNIGTFGINDGAGYFTYANSTVPYTGNDPTSNSDLDLDSNVAMWMSKNGINISNTKLVGGLSNTTDSPSSAFTNVVFDHDSWGALNFGGSSIDGVITFKNLPTNFALKPSGNLWLVVNGDAGSTSQTLNNLKVLEFGSLSTNIDNIASTGGNNPNNIRVSSATKFGELAEIIRGINRKAVWINNKLVPTTYVDPSIKSLDTSNLFIRKDLFAGAVKNGTPFSNSAQGYYTDESSNDIPKWGDNELIASLSPAKGRRADWWIDPEDVWEMARRMKGDILAPTAREVVLASLRRKEMVRGA
jgi:hypothetical protein